MQHTLFETAIGACAIAWNDTGLIAVELPAGSLSATEKRITLRNPGSERAFPPAWAQKLVVKIQKHLEGKPQDFSRVPIDSSLVYEFALKVFTATVGIPAGETRTYGEIAKAIGAKPGASRAVGAALGSNPWLLVVPCHRVVAADGSLRGFSAAGGLKLKARLLEIEGCKRS
jgi:methylated-DNA-[protein]-cysteine S-methyltransferase